MNNEEIIAHQIQINKLYNENCLATMSIMPDNFLDLTVTSPPYDDLRIYNGYSFEFEKVANELYRVTKPGGVIVWVVKDSVINGNKTLTSFKQALYFQSIGFNFYDNILYSKSGGMLPHKGRYRDAFEYMFVLSKGKPKTINLIEDRINKHAGESKKPSRVRFKDGTLRYIETEDKVIPDKCVRYNIWEYSNGTRDDIFGHPATFPENLAADHIISWSNENDLVYDCFMGSGTVAKECILLNRNYIGSEISYEYCLLAENRLLSYVNDNLIEKEELNLDYNKEIDFFKTVINEIVDEAKKQNTINEKSIIVLTEVSINQLSYDEISKKYEYILGDRLPSGILNDLKTKNKKFIILANEILSKYNLPSVQDIKWNNVFKKSKKFQKKLKESLIIIR